MLSLFLTLCVLADLYSDDNRYHMPVGHGSVIESVAGKQKKNSGEIRMQCISCGYETVVLGATLATPARVFKPQLSLAAAGARRIATRQFIGNRIGH
ncbi:hypothetical protein [Nocardia seriolae]|nr:hypothetical protein [Nocardia seriolae]MTJ61482.1 hypothetical protein [Nocardia seriolae]MTJ71666.1 hypothetical protein [Nocardia seriolae]MTJ86513.1 hypothetical protein [Nocardia seriolae]MTK30508.1 hypothetical protein [Nocardia seriolae]MTK39453.1 hypothetical protein [Nocardia seriolae]